jgi:parallel beta-helix repeat protein
MVGIFVVVESSAEITANTVLANGDEGIQIQGYSNATARDNVIRANHDDGIFVVGNSTAEIVANTITENIDDGVQIQDHSTMTMQNITLQTNGKDGIFVLANFRTLVCG